MPVFGMILEGKANTVTIEYAPFDLDTTADAKVVALIEKEEQIEWARMPPGTLPLAKSSV